jgi:hypothetical protein
MAKRRSLHIGLNKVDPDQYGGWDGALSGCINDANAMEQVAKSRGFTTQLLIDEAATTEALRDKLNDIAADLDDGDFFFLTYSGHGGQVPDENAEEPDGYDETWCLYDTELVDDSLYGALCTFKPGVRIFVMSDSCHSETVTREDLRQRREHRRAFVDKSPGPNSKRAPIAATEAEYAKNKQAYEEQSKWWPIKQSPGRDAPAKVVLIAGCQDNQTSMDGPFNGAFTGAFLQVWNNGDYTKAYTNLIDEIVAAVNNPDQIPQIFSYGVDVSKMLAQKPLSDDDPQAFDDLGGRG